MSNDNRPNPEELLKRLQAEEEIEPASPKGKLKIFLGFCAGVGKTYHMLEEAKAAIKNHIDVLIGLVETHGRKETEALLEGLDILPRKKIEYNGISLEEMDIDTILEKKPELVIVDELAHTNITGSRHEKRYQDVEEILNAGIDVYTTLNIQHIESLVDVVQQISYITIYETVPDSILELADQIELVDITPEDLIKRLKEGKVYIPEKAKQAIQKFFRKGNLLALREMSLRYTAKRVDEDMLSYKQKYSIKTPWPVGERLLVSFSASPTSERLLRITHRMASDMNAEWHAVYVSSPQQVDINEKARNQLDKNIRLAEELGAKVSSLSGSIIADEIINFAKEKNVSLIVAGLSYRSRLEEFFKGSVLNDLIQKSGAINVLIVGHGSELKPHYEKYIKFEKEDYKPYLVSFAFVALIVAMGWFLKSWIDPFNICMILLLPVIASSIFWGTRAGLFTSIIAVGAFDFFLVPPYFTFAVADLKYLPSFLVFVIISLTVSILSKSIAWQTENTRHRERFLSALYSFSREIMSAHGIEEFLNRATGHIAEAFQCKVVILLPDKKNKQLFVAAKESGVDFSEKEKAVASWVFKNGTQAGRNTPTLSSAKWHYLPLKSEETTLGVLGIMPALQDKFLSSEQQRLLEAFANVIAIYLKKL